jgi:hypothetical protein
VLFSSGKATKLLVGKGVFSESEELNKGVFIWKGYQDAGCL